MYRSVEEQLDDHVWAADRLKAAKIEFTRIVAVEERDAILFTHMDATGRERPFTAWIEALPKDQVKLWPQPGFAADPSPYLKDTG